MTIVALLALYGAAQLWPAPDPVVTVFYETSFADAPCGVVGFPSFNAKSGRTSSTARSRRATA